MPHIQLRDIAYARSGDKGAGANIGVIAFTPDGYRLLQKHLTAEIVTEFFIPLLPRQNKVIRYELPNLGALNFILPGILSGGGSVSLRGDAQGKALGQTLLQLQLPIADLTEDELTRCRDPRRTRKTPER